MGCDTIEINLVYSKLDTVWFMLGLGLGTGIIYMYHMKIKITFIFSDLLVEICPQRVPHSVIVKICTTY